MAGNSTVAAMTAASALDGTELLYSVQSSADRKATTLQMKTYSVGAGSVSVASGKTLTVSNSGTLAGGDAFVLAIAAAKTLTVSNSITLAGTDSTVMTFPATSTTVAGLSVANTFTATQTITRGTITDPAFVLDSSVTWNDAADTFTGWKLNVTNTASQTASKLVDIQVNSSTVFSLRRDGIMFCAQFATFADGLDFDNAGVNIGSAGAINFSSDATWYGTKDVGVVRASAGVVKVTNGSSGFGGLSAGAVNVAAATATPAGGSTAARLVFGTTAGFGIYYGSGAPSSLTAAQGSIYLRSDGTGIADRMYINTTGSTTWTNFVTAA